MYESEEKESSSRNEQEKSKRKKELDMLKSPYIFTVHRQSLIFDSPDRSQCLIHRDRGGTVLKYTKGAQSESNSGRFARLDVRRYM